MFFIKIKIFSLLIKKIKNKKMLNISKIKKISSLLNIVDNDEYMLTDINNVNFICSLTLLKGENDNLNKSNDRYKDVLFSTKLILKDLNINNLRNQIFENKNFIKINLLHVSVVSIGLDHVQPHSEVYDLNNYVGTQLIIEQYGYSHLMSNISSILLGDEEGINNKTLRIFIFQGLHLGSIIHLFKEKGLNLHGGSISLRHKLSSLERDLAIFLYISNIDYNSKKIFYYSYVDNVLSSNRINRDLFKYFNSMNGYVDLFDISNLFIYPDLIERVTHPILYIYILQSLLLDLKAESNNLDNKKISLLDDITKLEHSLESSNLEAAKEEVMYKTERE